jgi:hypothetical protein
MQVRCIGTSGPGFKQPFLLDRSWSCQSASHTLTHTEPKQHTFAPCIAYLHFHASVSRGRLHLCAARLFRQRRGRRQPVVATATPAGNHRRWLRTLRFGFFIYLCSVVVVGTTHAGRWMHKMLWCLSPRHSAPPVLHGSMPTVHQGSSPIHTTRRH